MKYSILFYLVILFSTIAYSNPITMNGTTVACNNAVNFALCANTEYELVFDTRVKYDSISTSSGGIIVTDHRIGGPGSPGANTGDDVRRMTVKITTLGSPESIIVAGGCTYNFVGLAAPAVSLAQDGGAAPVCIGQTFRINGSCAGSTTLGSVCAVPLTYDWEIRDASNGTVGTASSGLVATTARVLTSSPTLSTGVHRTYLIMTNFNVDGTANRCASIDSIDVTVVDTPSIVGGAPVLKGGGTAAVCVGGTDRKGVTVDPGGGNTYSDYEWHFNSGPVNFNAATGISTSGTAELDNITASVINASETPGAYNWGVKITDGNGCIARYEAATPFYINDIVAPTILATDASAATLNDGDNICEDDTINLNVEPCVVPSGGQTACSGSNYTSYRWTALGAGQSVSDSIAMIDSVAGSKHSFSTSTGVSSVIASMKGKLTSGAETNAVQYTIEVEGANGCVATSAITLTTKIKPTIGLWGDNTKQDTVTAPFNTCEGVAFNLWAQCELCPSGGGGQSYVWTDGMSQPQASGSGRELQEPTTAFLRGNYPYTITYEGRNGCSVDSTISVFVLETPNPGLQVLDTTNVQGEYCSNDTIKVKTTSALPGYTYTYYRKIGAEAEQKFNVNPADSSFIWTAFNETNDQIATVRYRVEVSAGGCSAEADTTIEVAQSPTVALSVARGYCTDSTTNTINLQPFVDGGSPFVSTNPNPYIYYWTIDGDTSVNGNPPVVYSWDEPSWESGALPEQQNFSITFYAVDSVGCRSPINEREFDVDYCGEIILVKTKNSNAVTAIDGRVCEGDTLNLEILGQSENEEYSYEWNGVSDSISTYSIPVDDNTPDTIFTRIIISRYRTDTVRYVCGQVPITTPIISEPLDPYTPCCRGGGTLDPGGGGGIQIQRTIVLDAPDTTLNSQTNIGYTSSNINNPSNNNSSGTNPSVSGGLSPNASISTANSFGAQTQYFTNGNVFNIPPTVDPATMSGINTGGFIYCSRVVSYLQIVRNGVDTSIVSRPTPVFLPSKDTSVCINEVLQASVKCPDCRPLIDYRFNSLPSVSGVTDPDSLVLQDFTITQDRVIQLTVQDFYQCVDTLRRTITASPLPELSIAGTGRYCPTGSALIEANTNSALGNSTYEWSTSQTSSAISVNNNGRYYVTATLGLCTEVDSIDVAQYPTVSPRIMDKTGSPITSSTYYICGPAGDTIYLDTSSCYNCTVQWNTGETTEDLFVNTQGGYYINIIDSNGCNGITPPLMVVQSTRGYNSTISAAPAEICGGQSAVLEVPPCVNCQYDWFYKTSPGNYAIVDSVRSLTTSVPGEYYAVVHNEDDCSFETAPFNVVSRSVGVPNIYGASDSICNTEAVDIWTDFDPAYTYQWFKDGGIISGEVDTILTTRDTGEYYVEVTFPNGCVETSNTWTIRKTTFKPTISAPSSVICQGASVIVSTPLRPRWTYQWYRNGGRINGATGSSYSATLPGEYYVNVITDYLCERKTDSIVLTSSSINQPIATTNTPNICFGDDFGQLSVSLCPGCSYQWYDNTTGLPVLDSIRPQYYRVDSVTSTSSGVKQYYAEVHRDGCFETSNLVSINFNAVVKPAIFSPSGTPSVCNGRSATLATNGCAGCDYNWFKDGIPVIGGPNDTVLVINSTNDTGVYSVEVTYPTLCIDTSANLTITNGGFPATITSSANNICNGANVTLSATPVNSQNVYTLFRGPTAVTGNIRQSSPNFITNIPGVYRIEVENNSGCRQLTPPFDLQGVNISPILTSRATSDPTSIDSVSAICGPNGRVFFEATNCPGCDFQFEKIGTPNVVVQALSADNNVLSDPGNGGAGNYLVRGELQGCQANSNLIQINYLPRLDVTTSFTDTSICDGSSIILSYDSIALSNCSNCGYRWLRDPIDTIGSPINGATNPNLTTTTAGNYALQITDLDNGCVDTSLSIRVIEVYPPVGFALQLDSLGSVGNTPGTPLASTGDSINLNEWIVPTYAQSNAINNATTTVWFTSAPYSGSLSPNAGIENDSIFNPDDSLSGFHLITYHFDTSGCEFTVSDVLEVLPPPGVDVVNNNTASVPYEACVSDTLVISTSNLNFPVDSVYVYDQQGIYTHVDIDSITVDTNVFGGFTVYNTTMIIRVPPDAKESSFKLVNTTGAPGDTILTAFVLIHNQDLQITGLPNMLCSNGSPVILTGTPSGGSFFVQDSSGNTLPMVMTGDTLDPTMLAPSYYVDGTQDVDVVYSFTESYTNGNLCPQLDTTKVDIEAREVFLNQVIYNEIAVSQDRELLTKLVSRVFPQRAKAIRPSFDISFSGSFTNPAGNPTHFLPNNAGVGRHALTYTIQNGDCINSVEDSITVIPAPTALMLPDTICSNHAPFVFDRDANYTFQANPPYFVDAGITSYTDTRNIISVRSTLDNQAIDTIRSAINLERYVYDVSQYADSVTHDTLIIEYSFLRSTDSLGVVDSMDYVIGKIYKPIFIEAQNDTVRINTNVVDSIYCEANTLHLLGGIPSTNSYGIGGYFTLEGGTGDYATEDTLDNNVINPYLVHNIDSTMDVNYRMIYYLDGIVCRNSDTMNVLIPERVNTDFFTATGTDEFCDSDPAVLITSNVVAPDTAIWKIGGVPQSTYEFKPQPLSPGIHIVELEALDIYGCRYSTKDTFTVHGLPDITFTPAIAGQYCTNDAAVPFVIDPAPYCPDFDTTLSQFVLNESFDGGIPATWTVINASPSAQAWQPDNIDPYLGAGAIRVDTTQGFDTDTYLVTDTLQFIAGHKYKITFSAKAGDLDPDCNIGHCHARMRVVLGRQNTIPGLTLRVPAYYDSIYNDAGYVPYSADFEPTNSGAWFLGLHVFTDDWGRAIRVDELKIRDITASACNDRGIGYMDGPGATNILDSAYVFNPATVDPGNYDVTYVYTNVEGCTDSVVQNITINAFPVVTMTDLDSFYCDNNPPQTIVGSPAGGQFSNQIFGNLQDTTLPEQFTPATYLPRNGGADVVRYDYTDPATLCSSFIEEYVFVQELTDTAVFDIDGTGRGFCEDENGIILTVTPSSSTAGQQPGPGTTGGSFYGFGVRTNGPGSGNATFYPDSAILDAGRVGDMELTYIFATNSPFCMDTTRRTVRIHANPDLTFMNLPDSICLNGDTTTIRVINRVIGGALGNIVTYDTIPVGSGAYTTSPSNFIGLFDLLAPNRGVTHPDPYAQVRYEYVIPSQGTSGCSAAIEDSVRLDSIPIIKYVGLDPYYCENQDSSLVMLFPTYKAGSGYLQLSEGGDTTVFNQSFYWVDPPALVDPSLATNQYNLYYEYEDTRGCVGSGTDSFEIRAFPRIAFAANAQDSFCRTDSLYNLMDRVPGAISYGFFTDNLALTSIKNDSLLNLAALPGPRLVTYNFTDSNTLCSNSDSFMVYVFNTPDLTFQTFGGCVGSDVIFNGQMLNANPSIDSVTNIAWDFGDGTIIGSAPLDTTRTGIPTMLHQYGASNVYNAILSVENQGLCVSSDTQKVIISPSVDLANGDYEEDFQGANGGWQDDQPINTTNSTQVWQYVPSLEGDIIKDSLNGAWVTTGNQPYGQGMKGWLYTPCFDFTQSERPMIKMDMWRSMLNNVDGVVLEYYDKDSTEWYVVGDNTEGVNWYQNSFVLARPGQGSNVTYAWSGESPMRSNNKAWEDPRFRLDQFIGKDDIRFRLNFATAPQSIQGLNLEGVAIDNVFVGERSRNVLVEHFSNEQHKDAVNSNMHDTDLSVYGKVFSRKNGLDVVFIQYASGNAGYDINYNINTADADARVLTYGLSSENRFLLNGMRVTSSNLSTDMKQEDLDHAMLQFPKFDINMGTIVATGANQISVSADVTRLEYLDNDSIDVHVVIIQDSLAMDSNQQPKRNVMRKMLPDNGGTEFSTTSFPIGVPRVITQSWDYGDMKDDLETAYQAINPNVVINNHIPTRLEAVVFVQNRRTKEVYQSATTQDINTFINVDNIEAAVGQEIMDLKLFPNPAYDFFNISFSQPLEGEYDWRLIDVMGRVLKTGTAEQGIETFQIQANELSSGTYFFTMQDDEVYIQRKVVIVR